MAAVVRVKRRRDDDPVEALMISCKRRKSNPSGDSTSNDSDKPHVESLLKYAVTITAKDVNISRHIRDAIRKHKLEKEYKHLGYNENVTIRNRQQHQKVSRSNRYKILNSYRAVGLEDLDVVSPELQSADGHHDVASDRSTNAQGSRDARPASGRVEHDGGIEPETSGVTGAEASNKEQTVCARSTPANVGNTNSATEAGTATTDEQADSENKGKSTTWRTSASPVLGTSEAAPPSEDCCRKAQNGEPTTIPINGCSVEKHFKSSICARSDDNRPVSSLSRDRGEPYWSTQSCDKVFCLYDVEKENAMNLSAAVNNDNVQPSSVSEFTCNSVPMVREVVTHGAADDDDYVYDLYYTNSSSIDFRMFESILRIEALQEDVLVDERREDGEYDEVQDDDDDSNDEDNWRNDYPEEDPQFYENVDAEYYGDDGVGSHMFSDDEEPLSECMSTRCNIEDVAEAPPGRYNPVFGPTATYEQYLKQVTEDVDLPDD